ncbi:MAG: 2-octaprenyl-3-methyl-6-methoxy-1,4-benzoquinol hydroxylase [Gammaproteobacteria bacterium]|jgi:2-octaprenyl-3-methyl-6-methoxy-1,4-benzoquinol hydroxylase
MVTVRSKIIMPEKNVDCCVIGGGMVGASLALGLAKQSYKVALIEKQSLAPFNTAQAPDIRLSALNMHAVNLLSSMGAWQHVQKMRYRSYNTLSVWDGESTKVCDNITDKKGITQFTAAEINQPLLGYFVENRLIQLALYEEIKANYTSEVECIHEQAVTHVDVNKGRVSLSNGRVIESAIILGADGANSQLRQAAGIPINGWQYAQKANAVLIQTKHKVADETWQAFYATGPRALLPMHDNYACLVWYHDAAKSDWIQKASKQELKAAINLYFPDLIGDFDIVEVAGFPLTRMHAQRYGQGKVIIAGDAAHAINPLAGQGVNLGFKDVAAILDVIHSKGLQDPKAIIDSYEQKRRLPNLLMMSTMDVLYHSFSTSFMPMKIVRGIGLAVAHKAGPVKQRALKYAMGLV